MARLIILFLLVTSIKIHAQLITSFNEADSLVLTKYIRDTVLVSEWVVGTVYQWAFLKPGNLPEYLLNKIGFKDKFYSDRPFKLKDFSRLFDKVLTESEDSGFPFAYVILDSLKISSGTISGVINYEPGPEITFDRLSVQGTDRISTDWLAAYLNIREGSTYSQKVIDEVIKFLK